MSRKFVFSWKTDQKPKEYRQNVCHCIQSLLYWYKGNYMVFILDFWLFWNLKH